jgi:hypothetical protein
MDAAKERGLPPGEVADFKNLPGQEAQARIEGRQLAVVSPGYLREQGIHLGSDAPGEVMAQGKTVVFLARSFSQTTRGGNKRKSAREILDERYARGEIDGDEHEEKKRALD